MDRNTSIFYKMTRENENSTTQLLYNILRAKYLRHIVLKYFGIAPEAINEITQDDIKPQQSEEDIGIPDIIIENYNSYYIIENKIRVDTRLRESQKSDYIEKIKEKNKKYNGYIFIIPKDYKKESIENIQKDKGYKVTIIEWQDFINYLKEMELDSPIIKESIEYLSEVILGCPVNNTLTIEEINIFYNPQNIYYSLSILKKYHNLINNNEEIFIKSLGNDFSPSDWAYDFYDVDLYHLNLKGKFINYNKKQCIFYGFDLNLITPYDDKKNKYVFSVSFDMKYLDMNKLKKDKEIGKYGIPIENKDWIYIKTDITKIINDSKGEEYFKEVTEIINNVFLKNLKPK